VVLSRIGSPVLIVVGEPEEFANVVRRFLVSSDGHE